MAICDAWNAAKALRWICCCCCCMGAKSIGMGIGTTGLQFTGGATEEEAEAELLLMPLIIGGVSWLDRACA